MNSWIFYAVLGMLQSGLMAALYKIPSEKRISKYSLSVWMYFFASLLASIIFHDFITIETRVLIFSIIWGTSYAILTMAQMHVLHRHDTSGVFPFTSLASNFFVVTGGVFFLHNSLSLLQWIAVTLAVFLFIGSHWNRKKHFIIEILPSFAFIASLSAFNKFIQNAGANKLEIHNFIFWQLVFACLASFIIFLFFERPFSVNKFTHHQLLGWALMIGILNFGGTYTTVKALSLGPISLVYIVIGLYTFFTTIFATLLFKEKITTKKVIFIIVSFLVVLLIKLG